MVTLSPAARALLESDALAHLVTLGSDGSPQVTCIWVGLDGDEIVSPALRRSAQAAERALEPTRRDVAGRRRR